VPVLAAPAAEPLPALSARWRVIPNEAAGTPARRPLTPGAARMLGFAACGGDWVMFVDADVEVDPVWIADALRRAARGDATSRLAGLWGPIDEWYVDGDSERPGTPDMYRLGDRERATKYLATFALYRREALLAAGGYEPRLTSEEDFELGLRLGALGYDLRSLPPRCAKHWSAPRPSFAELGRRWRHGLCFGQGQVLRLYWGRPGLAALVRRQAFYFAALGLWALGAVAAVASALARDARPFALWALLPLAVVAVMSARKRSVRLGALSLATWTLNGVGLAIGFARGFADATRSGAGAGMSGRIPA
jgi:hypothetical protein